MIVKQKSRGRPIQGNRKLNTETIIEGAQKWMLKEKKKLSIRGVANSLGVDPMAIYYYFSSKNELLEAVTIGMMESLYDPVEDDDWQKELKKLIFSYLAMLKENPGLLGTLVSMGHFSKGPAEVFKIRYLKAIRPLKLAKQQKNVALNLLADYIHGFAMGLKYSTNEMSLEISEAEAQIDFFIKSLNASPLSRS